jgi:hypothetical protein
MRVTFSANKGTYTKSDLAQMNIIAAVAQQGWTRPLYFSNLQETDEYGNMNDFMKLEGTVYRLMPYKQIKTQPSQSPGGDQGFVDIAKSIALFNNVYIWGGADRGDVYYDEKNRQNFIPYRLNAARIADELSNLGRKPEAIQLLDKVTKGINERSYSYDFTGFYMAIAYFHAGGVQQGGAIARKVAENARDDIRYTGTLPAETIEASANDIQRDMSIMSQSAIEAIRSGDKTTANHIIGLFRTIENDPAAANAHVPQIIQELTQMMNQPQQVQMPQQQ